MSASYQIDRSAVSFERIDDELIIINFDNGNYYSVDAVGADIWSLLEVPVTTEAVIERAAGRFSGAQGELEAGVRQFLHQLEAEKLIVSSEAAGRAEGVRPDRAQAEASTPADPDAPPADHIPFRPPRLQEVRGHAESASAGPDSRGQ